LYKRCRTDLMNRLHLPLIRFGFGPEITARLARYGARVFELGIAYYGRTYAEGKKFSWTDGVAALWHIVRFNLLAGDAGTGIARTLPPFAVAVRRRGSATRAVADQRSHSSSIG